MRAVGRRDVARHVERDRGWLRLRELRRREAPVELDHHVAGLDHHRFVRTDGDSADYEGDRRSQGEYPCQTLAHYVFVSFWPGSSEFRPLTAWVLSLR